MKALLENLIPYVEYAAAKGLPNADYYLRLLNHTIWAQRKRERRKA